MEVLFSFVGYLANFIGSSINYGQTLVRRETYENDDRVKGFVNYFLNNLNNELIF